MDVILYVKCYSRAFNLLKICQNGNMQIIFSFPWKLHFDLSVILFINKSSKISTCVRSDEMMSVSDNGRSRCNCPIVTLVTDEIFVLFP